MGNWCSIFFFQAEDGIRDLVRSRGLGDVYKRQRQPCRMPGLPAHKDAACSPEDRPRPAASTPNILTCLLYTSDAADERSSVDLGGRRIIKKKKLETYV